mmetsp:Transcript_14264/g.26168  ORF Transcript_14264/g.26168 Transcript_14264/m.26168 type:complete len:282 (+) Transcript_14264:189-1034(+)
MKHVRLARVLHGCRAVACGHSKIINDVLHGLFGALERKGELLQNLTLIAHLLPRVPEVAEVDLGDEIASSYFEVLDGVLLLVAISLLLPAHGVDADGGEVELAGEGAGSDADADVSVEDGEAGAGLAVGDALAGDLAAHGQNLAFALKGHGHVVKPLAIHGVLDLELKDHMFIKNMLDALDDVFCFGLGLLDGGGAAEDAAQVRQFRDGVNICGGVGRRRGSRGGGEGGGGAHDVGGAVGVLHGRNLDDFLDYGESVEAQWLCRFQGSGGVGILLQGPLQL